MSVTSYQLNEYYYYSKSFVDEETKVMDCDKAAAEIMLQHPDFIEMSKKIYQDFKDNYVVEEVQVKVFNHGKETTKTTCKICGVEVEVKSYNSDSISFGFKRG